MIILVISIAPTLAYANGCCCMQNISLEMSEDCHDQNSEHPQNICLCEEGLTAQSVLPSSQQTYMNTIYQNVRFTLDDDMIPSTYEDRLLRPPIQSS